MVSTSLTVMWSKAKRQGWEFQFLLQDCGSSITSGLPIENLPANPVRKAHYSAVDTDSLQLRLRYTTQPPQLEEASRCCRVEESDNAFFG